MFPVTITLNNADQLNAVMLALGGPIVGTVETTTAKAPAEKKPVAEKSPPPVKNSETAAVTATVDTQATAAPAAVPEQKAASSVAILDKDALTSATKAAIAKVGRDPVVALIQSYGAAKGSEIATEKRAEFDAKLIALAA
jgi:hypothetical protein